MPEERRFRLCVKTSPMNLNSFKYETKDYESNLSQQILTIQMVYLMHFQSSDRCCPNDGSCSTDPNLVTV